MNCILSTRHDPHFNLASEEMFLKQRKEDFFLLYRNVPSIVVGKHQNTLAEINLPYVLEEDLIVARRISGGGAVFHDLGNLNWAFITTGREGELVDYRKHTTPIIEALGDMGLEVKLGKRNELLLGKFKISGTASHVYKNRALHHGTLLFSSGLGQLEQSLRVREGSFQDKAVRSVRSEVGNIREVLSFSMEIEEFERRLMTHIVDAIPSANIYEYSDTDMKEIKSLKDEKFKTWEWNFGYSPKYEFSRDLHFGEGDLQIRLNVEKGIIREVFIQGSFSGVKDIHGLEDVLIGTIHDPETLRQRISGIRVSEYISGLENEQLLAGLF